MRNLLIALIYCGNLFAQSNFTEGKVKRLDGTDIIYYFQVPNLASTHSILLVLQGSGCKSVFKSAKSYGKVLEAAGIARLDVEKYGLDKNQVDCPQSYLENNRIGQRVEDYLRVIQLFRQNDKKWDGKLFIVGGSEGAVLAPIIASFVPETAKVVLMASGGGMTMRQNMLLIQQNEMKENGSTPEEIKTSLHITEKIMSEMKANPTSTKTWAGSTNTYLWWASILDILPMNFTVDLNFPILAVHGTADKAVDILDSRILTDEFKRLGKTNLTYKEYPGLDHHWDDASGKSHADEVVDFVFQWLIEN